MRQKNSGPRVRGIGRSRKPVGDHDRGISAEVDLAASDELGAAAVCITEVGLLQ